jgi:hypothetical protein
VHLWTSDTTISIPELRDTLTGRVITRGIPTTTRHAPIFDGGIDRHPAVIVKAAHANDVAGAVSLARPDRADACGPQRRPQPRRPQPLRRGIVLDLWGMKALDSNVEHHTARAQTGLTAGGVHHRGGAYGLATGFGDTGPVGLCGLTLGAGSATWSESGA